MKTQVIVHNSSYEGNGRSGEHLDAALKRGVEAHDLCEIKLSLHVSFTPNHPAVQKLTEALNELTNAAFEQKDANEVKSFAQRHPRKRYNVKALDAVHHDGSWQVDNARKIAEISADSGTARDIFEALLKVDVISDYSKLEINELDDEGNLEICDTAEQGEPLFILEHL